MSDAFSVTSAVDFLLLLNEFDCSNSAATPTVGEPVSVTSLVPLRWEGFSSCNQ